MKRIVVSVWLSLLLIFAVSNILAEGLMGSLPEIKKFHAKRASSYDRTWGNFDCLVFDKGTVTLAEINGPGAITHIWSTINSGDKFHLRNLVLRVYWDGEVSPSIECPIGDFFGLGHASYYHYYSKPIAIGTNNGLNCFWYMPFKRSAKFTLTNEGNSPVNAFYYYIDYQSFESKDKDIDNYFDSVAYFHAQYNQAMPPEPGKDYTILEAEGSGHYVGCNMSIELNSNGWWGEGDDKIYVDGNEDYSLFGTGSEDYFCGAWCYGDPFYGLYIGCPLRGKHEKMGLWNVYRYHLEDPIPFERTIKVDIETIHSSIPGNPADNYSSVAYWYQREPHKEFAALPVPEKRLPVYMETTFFEKDAIEAESLKIVETSTDSLISVQEMGGFNGRWSNNKQVFFQGSDIDEYFVLEFEVKEKGEYFPLVYITKSYDYALFDVYIDNKKINSREIDGFNNSVIKAPGFTLGKCRLSSGKHKIKFIATDRNPFSSGYYIGIDFIKMIRSERDKARKKELNEIIIDDKDLNNGFRIEGNWHTTTGFQDYNNSVHWSEAGGGESKAYWRPDLPKPGVYSVFIWYGGDPADDHASSAPFTVRYRYGRKIVKVNLKSNFGSWQHIGDYKFSNGRRGYVMASNSANGNVLADAVKFVLKK